VSLQRLRRALVSLALTLVAAGGLVAGAGNRVAASEGKCAGGHTRTLVENSHVRVYTVPSSAGVHRKFDVVACAKETGKRISLDVPEENDYAFLPPAIGLRGSVVGHAEQSYCGVQGDCSTSVQAHDMRYAGTKRDLLNGGPAGPAGHRLVKVGSLRVTSSGALIWITCPESARRAGIRGSQKPNCVRAGATDSVYRYLRRGLLKRLDRGRTIDPSSLRLHGNRASWKHGDERRHATLP
jgi:hypothetical protein